MAKDDFVCDEKGAWVKQLESAGSLAWHRLCGIVGPGTPNPLNEPWLPFPVGADRRLDRRRVFGLACPRRAVLSGVVAAVGDAQHAAQGAHEEGDPVRHHEFEDAMNVLSPLAANQAVALARMSRST